MSLRKIWTSGTTRAASRSEGFCGSAACRSRAGVASRREGEETARVRERAAAVASRPRGRSSPDTGRADAHQRARWRRPARAPFPARVAVAIGCCAARKNPNRRPNARAGNARRAASRGRRSRRGRRRRSKAVKVVRPRGGIRARRIRGAAFACRRGVERRTHLASCSVASKRFAGATTANAGAGARSWRAAPCLGATRAVRVSAMHMLFVELGVGVGHGGEARVRGAECRQRTSTRA